MTGQEMWDMELHQELPGDSEHYILRVPGGWIYTPCDIDGTKIYDSVFVPLNNEFLDGSRRLKDADM